MAAQFRFLVTHLGAHHEHAELNVLLGFGHIDADGDAIRLSDHQQLLFSRQQNVRLGKRTESARRVAGSGKRPKTLLIVVSVPVEFGGGAGVHLLELHVDGSNVRNGRHVCVVESNVHENCQPKNDCRGQRNDGKFK